uniref:B12-binding domain-containing radical SAM protein n=1 Tax=uncultured Thiotrichaceae bacterium TaxID=298394 RepID=A0A6S6T926_9GAMM|nr:MAG: B12-binding domain-containing radical SAM protein [uncultured Thiotrichaceae bacterium]
MPSVLIVDLNNFARYPTLAIGSLVAPLRAADFEVKVLSPLTVGAPPIEREKKENWSEHVKRRINFATHPVMQKLHEPLRKTHSRWQSAPHKPTLDMVSDWLSKNSPDIILLSAYLDHYPSVKEIASLGQQQGIPVLLGGPAFSTEETIREWLDLEGVSGIFAGEADGVIADLVLAAIHRKDIGNIPGTFVSHRAGARIAEPLQDLDQLLIPDFSDFNWGSYPHRIIPIMTGRGCSWGVCTFCSDVTTSNGRGYRSRSLDAVLREIAVQSERYQSKDFIFLDLKLNSNLDVWRGLIKNFQKVVPGGRWIGTVHVGKGENGLDYETLQAAKDSGLTRISFGMETGSQKLVKRMGKGTTIASNHQFVSNAHKAGLSVRSSMMLGYPGETDDDLEMTRQFLDEHLDDFDRVRASRFKAIPGTRFEKLYQHRPSRFKGIDMIEWDHKYARAVYEYSAAATPEYRKAKREILGLIHQINRKPLRDGAVQFDGLM